MSAGLLYCDEAVVGQSAERGESHLDGELPPKNKDRDDWPH